MRQQLASVLALMCAGLLPFALLLFSLWFIAATLAPLTLLIAWLLPVLLPWLLLTALIRQRRKIPANNRRPFQRHPLPR